MVNNNTELVFYKHIGENLIEDLREIQCLNDKNNSYELMKRGTEIWVPIAVWVRLVPRPVHKTLESRTGYGVTIEYFEMPHGGYMLDFESKVEYMRGLKAYVTFEDPSDILGSMGRICIKEYPAGPGYKDSTIRFFRGLFPWISDNQVTRLPE